MKTLYLECLMGAAGDMLFAALLSLLDDREAFLREFHALGLPGITVEANEGKRCGIAGLHVCVKVREGGHAHHREYADVERIIARLPVSGGVKQNALRVYRSIADAEAAVHGCPVNLVHFHEVGAMDAVADVTGVCLLMERLSPGQVICSPVHTGAGTVECAHGVLPVPAPATAELLKGIPCYATGIQGELCTPTGAALLRHFAQSFGAMPLMKTQKIGYGLGMKSFPAANCLRAFWGDREDGEDDAGLVSVLACNLDDMTGEEVGFAMERLWEAGALDVYWSAIGMKKSRPGIQLSAICNCEDTERITDVLLKHTTTLGVRRSVLSRVTLRRQTEERDTPLGKLTTKQASGRGSEKRKPEYESLAALAKEHGVNLWQAREMMGRVETEDTP